jgi:hypothetical protein
LTTEPPGPFASAVTVPGTEENAGPDPSVTVMLKLFCPVLPAPSVAVQVTLVVPIAKVEPEAGVQLGVTEETRSVALAEKVTVLPAAESASTVMFGGTVTVGGVVSFTVMVAGPEDAALPAPSVAVHVTGVEPTGNRDPGLWPWQSTVGATPLLSLALMAKVTGVVGPFASTVAPLIDMTGNPVSATTTSKWVEDVRFTPSVAVHVTGV